MRHPQISRRLPVVVALCGLLGTLPALAQQGDSRLDQVLDAIVANESKLATTLESYQPLVETYLQTVRPDPTVGSIPVKDAYFLGRLEMPTTQAASEEDSRSKKRRHGKKSIDMYDDLRSSSFKPEAFARMLVIDRGSFDREHYDFAFVRAEFLGEVRALVFDVMPREGKALHKLRTARFTGRIWVEDQDFNIVRYNGIYSSTLGTNLHFDSWRLNMAPGLWLPSYIYTEESGPEFKQVQLTHKGQTRIWGYDIERPDAEDEFTKVLIDEPETEDQADRPGYVSPVESARAWENEAEENLLRRLQRSGLLAPEGEVDQVLETVVGNLEITNQLNIQPPVRCRVLLTTPLESFTIGHTIVVSRGLIDVLPDESSLAMVLAHEMGHILSGHKLDTRYAFSDQMLVGDKQALEEFALRRNPMEEIAADEKAVALLENSPYKDKLGTAGLFLKALAASAADLPALISPHFGNQMATSDRSYRMGKIVQQAPKLDPTAIDQIAALPLGGRVKVDPWTARIELMTNNRVALLSPREKMPFQVTPLMPYLARYGAEKRPAGEEGPGQPASTDGIAEQDQETAPGETISRMQDQRSMR